MSLLDEALIGHHVVGDVVEDFKVGVDQFVVELYLLFGKLVVVGIDLVDELPVEVDDSLELLPY